MAWVKWRAVSKTAIPLAIVKARIALLLSGGLNADAMTAMRP